MCIDVYNKTLCIDELLGVIKPIKVVFSNLSSIVIEGAKTKIDYFFSLVYMRATEKN